LTHIEKFRFDFLFRKVADGEISSQETYRQRLDVLAEKDGQRILNVNVSDQLSRVRLTRIDINGQKRIPLDIDVSVFEDTATHKAQGFAPIFCDAGREGFMIVNELRPRSQHCESGAVKFLKRCIAIIIQVGYKAEELLVRVDSGHDSSDFIKTLLDLEVKYLVKRNLRKESPRQLFDSIRYYETSEQVRPGKVVYHSIRSDRIPTDFPEYKSFIAVEVLKRTVLANEQTLRIPSIELANLPYSVRQHAALYHNHGTSEQFHNELKTDMRIELLPSGNRKKDTLVLGLATVAFNCIRFIGPAALQSVKSPTNAKSCPLRYRHRTVLLDFIKVGCKIVSHANQIIQNFGKDCPNFFTMKEVYSLC